MKNAGKVERNQWIFDQYKAGKPLRQLAEEVGLSRSRTMQIIERHRLDVANAEGRIIDPHEIIRASLAKDLAHTMKRLENMQVASWIASHQAN